MVTTAEVAVQAFESKGKPSFANQATETAEDFDRTQAAAGTLSIEVACQYSEQPSEAPVAEVAISVELE